MVIEWDVTLPALTGKRTRKAYIYLPDCYNQDDIRRYPVLYMFDGQNVFFDNNASFGKSWGMNAYMTWTRKPLIIVGVECNTRGNGRLREYSPVSFSDDKYGNITGQGKKYMNWLVNELKPYIDENYRTLPDREHTYICGSSMGGLMALYGVCDYNHVFKKAACISPSFWMSKDKVLDIVTKADISTDSAVYIDYGSLELPNHTTSSEALIAVARLLLTRRVNTMFKIVPGGIHNESSWEKQIPQFMEYLAL